MISRHIPRRKLRRRTLAAVVGGVTLLLAAFCGAAHAQLRVVTYNTNFGPDAGTGMETIFKSIGEQQRNGIAKPIDVLLLQEQSNPVPGDNSPSPTTQGYLSILNTAYTGMGVTYAMGDRTGSGDSTQSIIYRTETVELISENAFGNVGGAADQQPRSTLQYQLRPVGYTSSASNFWIFNSHMKAGETATDKDRRNIEASAIKFRANNFLGQGTHVIFAGDFNLYTAEETAFQTLISSGNGQAIDPLGLTTVIPGTTKGNGEWSDNSGVAVAHTQAPCVSGCGSAGGGMDDRFDFLLSTGEFDDDEGLSIIDGSYHTFGNNGSTYNVAMNNASNTYVFTGVTSYAKPDILNALSTVTDHAPVVADYQLPAMMEAVAASFPSVLDLDELFDLDVTVSNIADVVAAIGADELDFTIAVSGNIVDGPLSPIEGSDLALGGGQTHPIALDTTSLGMKSGTISVTSSSQGVQFGMINIPISFDVVAPFLPGDHNEDGVVDAADYVEWRKLNSGDADAYDDWVTNFGRTDEGMGGSGEFGSPSVPEPAALTLLMFGTCMLAARRGTLAAWTRRP